MTAYAFNELKPWRADAHLRELLMSCGLMPTIDKQLLLFERWLPGHLVAIGNWFSGRCCQASGMLSLWWKRLSGSYFRLTALSRGRCSP